MATRLPLLAACLVSLVVLPSTAAAHAFHTGFFDDVYLSSNAAERAAWLDRSASVGADTVRIQARWSVIAPRRPANPGSADDPTYQWSALDAAVRDSHARGLNVLLTISSAPKWAEGAHAPRYGFPGTWKPNVLAFGKFVRAIATRYSGQHVDPSAGGLALPAVHDWQIWNEPNLDRYLAPQWIKRASHRYTAFAPGRYRALLNAGYTRLKAVSRSNLVVTAGTSPYGDPLPGGGRAMPVRFWREFTSKPVRFDVAAHHPYAIQGPFRTALNADDAAVPDIWKIERVVRQRVSEGKILPRKKKRFWVTEISWDSRPPDPHGVPVATHARWLEEALYVLARQGVDTVLWYQVRDQLPVPSYAMTLQSGVFTHTGKAKPAARAFYFPFVVRSGRAWGRAPLAGTLAIQRRDGKRWKTIRTRDVGARQVFNVNVAVPRGTKVRALVGQVSSLGYAAR